MSLSVFADLDLPKPDEHFLKASLPLAIADIMRKSGLTQMDIAQIALKPMNTRAQAKIVRKSHRKAT